MNPGGLAASAAINLGLAVVLLSLFSVLKRQPGNALVYLARCLAAGQSMPGGWCRSSSVRCAVPSFAWIPTAFRLSEEEVVRLCGLDALVVLRLFKFGIKFFSVCSIVGLLILVPVNYSSRESPDNTRISHSLDSFSISKVERGSNWLCVHFSCMCFISFYVTYLLHKNAKANDDMDEQEATEKDWYEQAVTAYKPPWMCAEVTSTDHQSCSTTEPLISC